MRHRAYDTAPSTAGMHRPTPADIDDLAALAERLGRPLNEAARAFLAAEQRSFGIGYDGRLWVNSTSAVTAYERSRLYEALRHGYRVARALGEVRGK